MADRHGGSSSGTLRLQRNTSYGTILDQNDSASASEAPLLTRQLSRRSVEQAQGTTSRLKYWAYYLPALNWLPQYQWQWLFEDTVAALTVASLYIPMCFAFAVLAQVDPISGLYASIIHPLIYAFLGSCPQMVVGPEATGSLLVGAVNRQFQRRIDSDDRSISVQISGVTTAIAGAMLFIAGLGRLGFVDGVLSRPFMKGFIAGVGFVLVVEQAIPELGLVDFANDAGLAKRSSAVVKLSFLLTHLNKTHALTATISLSSLAFILISRTIQKATRVKHPFMALIPDRLIVVVVTTIVTWKLRLDQKGIDVLGSLGTSGSKTPSFHWPLSNWTYVEEVFTTSFIAALLGFFESTVAAKSLRPERQSVKGNSLSANRELIALGAANLIGGCFTTLPAFGGFGRSKLNVQAGGRTPMTNVLLSILTLLCVYLVLPALYFVPKPVLSAMASAVGISMLEECPHDIHFFAKMRGWRELSLMIVVFLSTAFHSMSLGAVLGIILTLFGLVRHSTQSRLQLLGNKPGNTSSKRSIDDPDIVPEGDQFERCLIVHVPEPLTFANVGDLRNRLRRLEEHGTYSIHPSQPRTRDVDGCIIFDLNGMTAIDACATQILAEMVQDYARAGVQVVFCRVRGAGVLDNFQRSGIVELCGGDEYIVNGMKDALRVAAITT